MGLGFHGAKGGLLDRGHPVPLPFRHVIRPSAVEGRIFYAEEECVCFR